MTSWEEILEYVRRNYQTFAEANVGGIHNSYGAVRSLLELAGFYITEPALDEIVNALNFGMVDVCVKKVDILTHYGPKFWNTVEVSSESMLLAQIPLWLSKHGYLDSSAKFIEQPVIGAWDGEWHRYGVSWGLSASDVYFVYIGSGHSELEGKYVFARTEKAADGFAVARNLQSLSNAE